MEIKITSTRKNGEWTATATLNGQFAGSCTTKSKAYAESEARRAGEIQRAQQLQQKAMPVGACALRSSLSELRADLEQRRTPTPQFDNVSPFQVAAA